MKKIREHVHGLFKEIPDSEIKKSMEEEIIQNLDEKVQDLIEAGKKEEDAINKAIVDFGDIEDIKKELNEQSSVAKQKLKLKLIFSLWACGLIVAVCIFINLYFTPDIIWFIFPVFVIIWWPFILFYRWHETRS